MLTITRVPRRALLTTWCSKSGGFSCASVVCGAGRLDGQTASPTSCGFSSLSNRLAQSMRWTSGASSVPKMHAARVMTPLASTSGRDCGWRHPSATGIAAPRAFPAWSHRSCAGRCIALAAGVASETPTAPRVTYTANASPVAFEILQGSLLKFSSPESVRAHSPPTAVLVHGILGSRKNLQNYALRILRDFPAWQVVLVDLRNHGEAAQLYPRAEGPHTVDQSAADILALLSRLKLFPNVLIGHSFGGKVVLSMARQFAERAPVSGGRTRLPRRVDVWVLDTVPGQVFVGGPNREDHPEDLIRRLQEFPTPVKRRQDLVEYLTGHGFSIDVARWMTTNLRPLSISHGQGQGQHALGWAFNLDGIAEMYQSYQDTDLWPFVSQAPEGLDLNFVRAERSTFRWAGRDVDLLASMGASVHLLEDAGHWVHADNPEGLFRLMAPSFEGGTRGLEAEYLRRREQSLAS